LPISAPSPDIQRQIADYLDHETAEIDAFIADLGIARAFSQEASSFNVIGSSATTPLPPRWLSCVARSPSPTSVLVRLRVRRICSPSPSRRASLHEGVDG
jgi:hypothetical protein